MAFRRAVALLAGAVLTAATLLGCGGEPAGERLSRPWAAVPAVAPPVSTPLSSQLEAAVAAGVPSPRLTVLGTLPHDPAAWTQGLEIADGVLFEGTGLRGRSQLRELDPATGRVTRVTALPGPLYGEGITVIGSRVRQLTWQDRVAVDWDRASLQPAQLMPWDGEGWGLCEGADGRLVASDGTDVLRMVDPGSLELLARVPVRLNGRPLAALNELECADGVVWANVYQTDWLVRIQPDTGMVSAAVDASGLLTPDQRSRADVLNGIAHLPGTDEFLVTGKLWPTVFRVRFDG